MGGELGNETYTDLLLVSSALSPPKFHLDRKRQYLYEISVKKLVFWVFADISARSSRGKKVEFFIYVRITFFFAQSVVCQG